MKKSIFVTACLLATAGCAPPGPPAATPSPVAVARQGYTAADVAFMQGMIGHHAQALTMAALVPDRTTRQDFHLMAERIRVSQVDEIALMKRWLAQRGEEIPADDAHVHAAMGHGTLMPGMLSAAEIEAIQRASGTSFERLFLEGMIKHHEGAIQMVDKLFTTPAAGQEAELYMFATDVNADQAAEIRRMRAMLDAMRG